MENTEFAIQEFFSILPRHWQNLNCGEGCCEMDFKRKTDDKGNGSKTVRLPQGAYLVG